MDTVYTRTGVARKAAAARAAFPGAAPRASHAARGVLVGGVSGWVGAGSSSGERQASGVNGSIPKASRALSHCSLGRPVAYEASTSRQMPGRRA